MLELNSLCKNTFLIFFGKFPVFSLSGKMDLQIPCFPCAVATLFYTGPVSCMPQSQCENFVIEHVTLDTVPTTFSEFAGVLMELLPERDDVYV